MQKSKFINPNEYGSLFYDEKEKEYLNNVVDEHRIFRYAKSNYSYTYMCEDYISKMINVNHTLMVTNGTSGLKTALVGAGVMSDDRVLISSYTFLATALAAIAIKAVPVPIDVDLETGLNVDDLKREIEKGCKAIIVVHFQGRAFDLTEVKKIAKANNIVLIEDACQAFGAKYHNQFAGTFGDIGVYSFQQFKQISCGEGGAVVTNNPEYYERMRNYTDMGSIRDRYPSWNDERVLFGENYRMNNLNAAVLYAQLEKFAMIIKRQEKSRTNIMQQLAEYKIKNILESKDPNGDTAMNILIILNNSKDKEKVINLGLEQNIELRNMWSSLYYDNDLFRKNYLTAIDLKNRECMHTKELIEKMLVISIPPILNETTERQLANFILKLKNENYME